MAGPSRRALIITAGALSAVPGAAFADAAFDGRLTPPPSNLTAAPLPPGLHRLPGGRRGAELLTPDGPGPFPLMVVLHGATHDSGVMIRALGTLARARSVALLAPNASGETWDLQRGPRGADARAIDSAITAAFAAARLDSRRIACAGFSDGASYALSLGLTNGEVFSDVLAFSPGYFAAPSPQGRPRVFIAHGRADPVLPFANSRKIADLLGSGGYDVEFHAFEGRHELDPGAVHRGFDRFLA